jgi:hypothetical protein
MPPTWARSPPDPSAMQQLRKDLKTIIAQKKGWTAGLE